MVSFVRSTLSAVPPLVGIKFKLYTAKSLSIGVSGNIVLETLENVRVNVPFPSGGVGKL
jgi:hypothetical protein